ncbi:hypothetical protein GCM10028791_43330 [Echinicola sediminis]
MAATRLLKAIETTLQEVGRVLGDYFVSDTDVMSNDMKKIMANPKDRKSYINAVKKLKDTKADIDKVDIKLSTKEEITISLHD